MQDKDTRQTIRFPAPVNDQWNYLLSTIWNQTMHLVVKLDGRLMDVRLRRAAELVMKAEPLLACRFVGGADPHWEVVPSFRPQSVFSLFGNGGNGKPALRRVLAGRIDPAAGPQAHFTLVRGETDTLIISVNHAVCDARGLSEIATLLALAYRGLGQDLDFSLPPSRMADRSFHPFLPALTIQERAAARECCGEQSAEWGMPWEPGTRGRPAYRFRTVGPPLFGEVKAYSRSFGVTVNDIMLAAFFASVGREIPHQEDRDYPVLTSIDLRRAHRGEESPAVANLSVAFEVWLPAGLTGRPRDLVNEAHRAMEEKKRLHVGMGSAIRLEEMFSSGFDFVREHLLEAKRRSRNEGYPKNPFISNIGVLPRSCADFGDARTKSAFVIPPVEYPPGFGIAASTYGDTLTLSCSFCEGPLPGLTVERVLISIEEFLSALTRG
ncbi:MAG: hypothetical protein A4E37_01926 [Methanoregulaceae archaeon PtaB.Bin056]|jgi:NRPS condensation-like uncharacterized protein|nr:MAG: hypothetical protein A4E37_01926 [Methanoregulaceae archaeon PtaB.Bin056]